MSRRFFPALAVAVGAIAFAASPALAATQHCKTPPPCTSAVCVYVEQPPTSGACSKKTTSKPAHHPTTSSTYPRKTTPVTPPATVTPSVPTNPKHQRHHKRSKPLKEPAARHLHATPVAANVKPPSAAAAAFDLGSGPTALFAGLLAVAALLAVGGGLHRGRRR